MATCIKPLVNDLFVRTGVRANIPTDPMFDCFCTQTVLVMAVSEQSITVRIVSPVSYMGTQKELKMGRILEIPAHHFTSRFLIQLHGVDAKRYTRLFRGTAS